MRRKKTAESEIILVQKIVSGASVEQAMRKRRCRRIKRELQGCLIENSFFGENCDVMLIGTCFWKLSHGFAWDVLMLEDLKLRNELSEL